MFSEILSQKFKEVDKTHVIVLSPTFEEIDGTFYCFFDICQNKTIWKLPMINETQHNKALVGSMVC